MAVALFFVCVLLAANWVAVRSWHGTVYVYMGERRAPASVRASKDYTPMDRQVLFRSVHEQIMAEAQTKTLGGDVDVTLGHPLVASPDGGGRDFACEVKGHSGVYDRMELTFYGTGISDNGDEPHMLVDTACASSGGTLGTLDTITIPMQDITSAEPRDQELQVSGPHPAMIRLQHIPGQWPENWVLTNVRFYREDDPDQQLNLDARHLRETGTNLLSFDYKIQK